MAKARRCTICNAPIPDHKPHNATICSDECKRERGRRVAREYRRRHPEKRAASVNAWLSKQRPGEVKARRHGLDYESYVELLEACGHACTICGSDKDLRIDHDHTCCPEYSSGCCVRGILCHRCNITLGQFGDSIDHLAAAIRYLLGERGSRLVDGGLDALKGLLR